MAERDIQAILDESIEAHGGEDFWRGLSGLDIQLSASGFLFAAKGRPVAIKYRDGNDTWTGRGNKPRWLVARLAEGKQLADFTVS